MSQTLKSLGIGPEEIRKYDQRIPRYTSYPTAPFWKEEINAAAWCEHLEQTRRHQKPLSIYVHIPFCGKRCFFCGCNAIVTRKAGVAQAYLELVAREIEMTARLIGSSSMVQLHLGGGTPSFLSSEEMSYLMKSIQAYFKPGRDAELSIEVDPRTVTPETVAALYEDHGFNRISFGVQDFNADVQEAIGREQTRDITFKNVQAAREVGFNSVNIDLIYGLPRQTVENWRNTIRDIIDLRPDRIALYNFAYLPDKLRNQKFLDGSLLPSPDTKLDMFIETHDCLTERDWVFIGMDHYALKEDSLNIAQKEGSLRRNFMGYTTLKGTDLISFGVSSISDYQSGFGQNVKKLSTYKKSIQNGVLPIERGLILNREDRIRQHIIESLMCNGFLSYQPPSFIQPSEIIERVEEVKAELNVLEENGLIEFEACGLRVSEKGRVFLRNIAVLFDSYLNHSGKSPVFSRAV